MRSFANIGKKHHTVISPCSFQTVLEFPSLEILMLIQTFLINGSELLSVEKYTLTRIIIQLAVKV